MELLDRAFAHEVSLLKYFYKHFKVLSFIMGMWDNGVQFQSTITSERSSLNNTVSICLRTEH